ncbi:uncharacterized protein L3040_001062 [Drepanopeziza brunnea f. sp. 'multigermtubi']|uniref:Ilp is an apoptosis inhibitor n=1 Tax=Marssonina brunnea f. sp. multigermtubi (strain MB_m1) TaxID=1072389 RepID=K1XIX9_MARBU|nr:uncharacterized protein MBM_09483 [Drepanopeziza brunnea f. sp. 'multigermtubi' MB_m1]EKD12449.1 hypothetical protein MBM_09483 [Drepanopeziza brunnea f. sp. 'multigermtubi' MB_m1]KAJ5054798.1 hypothetical protein L3040_001062 [Drepanopeziza brunnea f. sp. 'multigermtubi']
MASTNGSPHVSGWQSAAESPRQSPLSPPPRPPPEFEIYIWHPRYQMCMRYFLDHAQHSIPVQALADLMNIQLPFQMHPHPINRFETLPVGGAHPHERMPGPERHARFVSLVSYIRRLVATGHDNPRVLHGFFGDEWQAGVGGLHEIERRNYMFAAKSVSWLQCKEAYDMNPHETVPFMQPLKDVTEEEILRAEVAWSDWMFMQDWKLGPRSLSLSPPPGLWREGRN